MACNSETKTILKKIIKAKGVCYLLAENKIYEDDIINQLCSACSLYQCGVGDRVEMAKAILQDIEMQEAKLKFLAEL